MLLGCPDPANDQNTNKLKAIPKDKGGLFASDDALKPICTSLLYHLAPIQISFGDRRLNGHCQMVGLNGGNFLRGCDDECWHTVNALPLDKDFCQSFHRTLDSRILSAEISSHVPFLKITTRFASGFQVDRPIRVRAASCSPLNAWLSPVLPSGGASGKISLPHQKP